MIKEKRSTIALLALLLLSVATPSLASQLVPLDTLSVKVYYRQGEGKLDTLFQENGLHLSAFAQRLATLQAESAGEIKEVRIIAGASPEGSVRINKSLSRARATSIISYLEQKGIFTGQPLDVKAIGVDWDGLTTLVDASDMCYRTEVLKILREIPEFIIRDRKVVGGRQEELGMLRGGRPWHYMYEHFFSKLRAAGVTLIIETTEERQRPPTAPVVPIATEEEPEVITTPQEEPEVVPEVTTPAKKPFYMALKTNLLYDLALVPNIGAELYLGKGWTIGGNWMYAWWSSKPRDNYWRTYGGELSLRKYFGQQAAEKPLTGHHLGLYGQIFTYDFELGGTGYMGGKPGGTLWDKMNYAGGLEYGYSLPITRRLNLDFVIGAGYWGGEYHIYDPVDGYYIWNETRQRHYFGPTKAEISLVWLIGQDNYNSKKGGKR